MRQILTSLAVASLVFLTAAPVVAQSPPDAAKKEPPKKAAPAVTPQPATPPPAADAKKDTTPAIAKTDRSKVETGIAERRVTKHRRHVRRAGRHRTARHHRNRWRYVWVYKAHDRHGYRHYRYVPRKFGGYFASGRGCGCYHHHHARRWHL